ncbi:hypothetical protein SAMN04487981_10863 [Streptomyces sp. cf386]|uniref:peptidase inhibitor family I36 protein n=1 Tax=Streptomyces sp. cf386 TaxID=1761904 RepID=UPI00087F5ACA|nr:peptidase inhibitor family I36 protein [Streptomyces sp. cf386]SDO04963.1 hypothetical protein SAMN04487981_10863 [Streptomyces sp. cf386]
MLKTRIATALAAVGVTALSLTVLPGAAQASESTSSSTRAVAAADGYLHVWEHQKRGGRHCQWSGNANWASCNMRNQGSSVENGGFTHDVWLYYGPDQTGAHFCLNRGVYLENIVHHYFPHNGAGGGQSLNDNIASHKWVADC